MNPLYLAMLQQPQGQMAQSGIPPFLPSPDQPNPFIASLMPSMADGTIPNTPAESIGVANTATPNPLLSLLTQNTGNASPATSSPSYSNPFDAGITKAIEAAKESMKASQAQKGEALTSALTAMAKAASQAAGSTPWGMGRGAGIGRILATAAPYGVDAYTQSEKAAESQNLGLADYMVKLKATQQDALRQAFKDWKEQDYKDKTLKATTDHHQQMEKKQDQLYALKKQKYGKESEKQNRMDALIAQGHIPLDSLTPTAQADYEKRALKAIDDIPEIKRNIEGLARMEQIIADKPHLATSWIHTLSGSEDKESSFWGNLGRNFANPDDLAAIQELDKIANGLNFGVIQTVPGKTATNMLKEIIRKASVHSRLNPKAFKNISRGLTKKFAQKLDMAHQYKAGLPLRIVVSDTTGGDMDIEQFLSSSLTDSSDNASTPVPPSSAVSPASSPLEQMSTQELQQAIATIKQKLGRS